MPAVSVIIPSFNGADYVCTAVASALAQSMRDLDVIVVDDGSTDNTFRALEPYLSDQRLHYHFQSNRGLPGARNAGCLASTSEYLAFLDADDELRPDALEIMMRELSGSGSAWCLIDILKCRPGAAEVQRTEIPSGDLFYAILRDDFVRRGMFFRREPFLGVGMYDESMKNREDWDLNIRMFAAGLPYSYVPEPLYLYTRRKGSITTGNCARVFSYTEKLLKKHHKALADAGDGEAEKIYARLIWGLSRDRLYQASDYRGALRCAWESLRYDFSLARVLHPVTYHLHRLAAHLSPSPKG
jgi:glycosyltransferase involved in cell wall biosynthesis